MRSTRIAISAALLGALTLPLPLAFTTTASAAPAQAPSVIDPTCTKPGPWTLSTKAVTIRAKASVNSEALGILYRGHKFTVHKTSGNWRYITDRTTGVKGWVSAKYVYRPAGVCLD